MSDTDSFIEEVTEEVRRDRLFHLMRRYGWIAVTAILVLVGGAAWNEYRKAQARAQAEALGDSILAALENEAPEARAAALSGITAPDARSAAVLGLMQAAEQGNDGDDAAAIAALEKVAANGDIPEIYRQIASFKALVRGAGITDADTRRIGFEALANPGAPLRMLAEEQLALLDLDAGNTDGALERLQAILIDAETTAGLRQRATQLIVALGGTPQQLADG